MSCPTQSCRIACSILPYVTRLYWPKPSTYAHNDKVQFSLPINNFINKITNHYTDTLPKSAFAGEEPWQLQEKHLRKLDLQMDSNEVLLCLKHHKK